MTTLIPGVFTTVIFLLVTWIIFNGLLITTADQTDALGNANDLHEDQFRTLISITGTGDSGDKFVVKVLNNSKSVSFEDFSKLDLITRYIGTGGAIISKRLTHSTDWSVPSISGDDTNPKVWDPGETVTILFEVRPAITGGAKAALAVVVPGGIADSTYFEVGAIKTRYLHNDPTPPTSDTASHAVLTADTTAPTATTLFNYDTNRDSCTGLKIAEGGVGAGESGVTLHQVWRTDPMPGVLLIAGDVTFKFWSALRDPTDCSFVLAASGDATMFLRDHDGAGSYKEIGSATTGVIADWQGGVSDFVEKTITISGVSYTVPTGHELEAKVIVSGAAITADAVWFAYDTTAFSSVVTLP